MPRTPRKSYSFGRKSPGAKSKATSRGNETDEERASRLEDKRQRASTSLQNETQEERASRLEQMRQRASTSLQNETQEERASRLEDKRQRASTSLQNESQEERASRLEDKRQRASTSLQNETQEERASRLEDKRQRASTSLQNESQEERASRLEDKRQRASTSLQNETQEERASRLEDKRQRASTSLQNEPDENRIARLTLQKRLSSASRESESPEKRQKRQQTDTRRIAHRRNNPASRFKARNADAIFGATQMVDYSTVEPLYRNNGTQPNHVCSKCKAIKWKKEPPSMCCQLGKVQLPAIFENQPDVFKALWEGADEQSKTFRKYSRQLNNALALACLRVDEPTMPGGGWKPSVVIQGKVFIGMGPIQPTDDRDPVFAQLYVLDPAYANNEGEMRFHNMALPSSVTEAERRQLRVLLIRLQNELKTCNGWVQDMMHAHELVASDNPEKLQLVIDETKKPDHQHRGQHNKGFKEISVLMDDEHPGKRSFVVVLRGPGREVMEIPDTNRAADPLHFVLLLPDGSDGWSLDMKQHNSQKRCTALQFYAYYLQQRYQPGSQFSHPLLRAGKLFQEFVCVSYAKAENQRLKYIAMNQKELRGESYSRLAEDVHKHQVQGADGPVRAGQKIILPPSFTGSPRYMHSHFQNATAILREYHKPDAFITFTCNSQWPEIVDSLLPGQAPHDRPDLVARVFHLKLVTFLNELIVGQILGRRAANIHVIEFQKRGLPHSHILFILQQEDRLQTSDDVDNFISAELPADPLDFAEGPQRDQAQKLHDAVLKHMVHSCGPICKDKDTGKCNKGFPKPFCDATIWDDQAFYPTYRRRPPPKAGDNPDESLYQHHATSAEYRGKLIDNRWIVPYCPYLLLRYDAHINVEVCASAKAAKYLFMYVNKGSDRSMAAVSAVDDDEVKTYQNLRSYGASEACWRFLQFDISANYPAVQPLRVHLEGRQYVVFTEGEEEEAVADGPKATELNEFFANNAANSRCQIRYVDYPKHFVWNKSQRKWTPRKRGIGTTIGRVHTIHPLAGDEFYLRILLHNDHCKGATSFEHLRTVEGQICETYKEVCTKLNLLRDDKEWDDVLTDASHLNCCPQIRRLYITIVLFCEPTNPRALMDKHIAEWWDDFKRRHPIATEAQLATMVILDIDEKLQERGQQLADFNLPTPTADNVHDIADLQEHSAEEHLSVVHQEERNFDLAETIRTRNIRTACLTPSQGAVLDKVMTAVTNNTPLALFLNARGGTGKTYTLNTILAAARTLNDEKNVALAVASSGIAATLLTLGRTFHSRFKVPINHQSDTMSFNIRPTDALANVIRLSKVIVWDEAPMSHRHLLEALDRSLRDITECDEPFGGKVIVLAGDFRQVMPVIPRASRAKITEASIIRSKMWHHFQVMSLNENLRVGQDPDRQDYDAWLLQLGDGTLPIVEKPDYIQLPPAAVFDIDDESFDTVDQSMQKFADIIFPDLLQKIKRPPNEWIPWVSERAILAPRNVEVDQINAVVTKRFPGTLTVLRSADSTIDPNDNTRYPIEYLNSLTPTGLPPHEILVKENLVLMLLRNISPRQGLCNGTRLILQKATTRLLQCKIATGERAGEDVLIPRIELSTKDDLENPVKWRRRQFPVRPAFAITINKSQGQTLRTAGVWLQEPVFTHGQLYVAASRVGDPTQLHFAVPKSADGMTRNVVYTEALL